MISKIRNSDIKNSILRSQTLKFVISGNQFSNIKIQIGDISNQLLISEIELETSGIRIGDIRKSN